MREVEFMSIDDEQGGDPACWSHLFEDDNSSAVIDLAELANIVPGRGPIWTRQTDDLNVNLLRFSQEEGVAEHVNSEVDVLILGIAGHGTVTINGAENQLGAGQAVIVPKGAVRAISSTDEFFSYLTCHRRRAGLMPKIGPRS